MLRTETGQSNPPLCLIEVLSMSIVGQACPCQECRFAMCHGAGRIAHGQTLSSLTFELLASILVESSFQLAAMSVKTIARVLRERGFKMTTQRRAILKVITALREPLTPVAIYEHVRRDFPSIGVVTVYRTLDVLSELDLLCQVHGVEGCRSYVVRRPSGHHHHAVCSSCGKVIDFKSCDLGPLERRLSSETGFKIEGHLLEFSGVCRECAR